jgi:PAS domain S-box-containing protein
LTTCVAHTLRVKDSQKKRQSIFVTIGFAVPITTFIITNIVFPLAQIDLPNLGHIANLAFGLSVGYAIYKYDLFTFDAAIAAENIISTMPDSLVLADMNGRIVRINKKFSDFFGYNEQEVIGQLITKLFVQDEDKYRIIVNELHERKSITSLELKIVTKQGETKDTSTSASLVRYKNRDIGFACIIHDISLIKQTEKELENNTKYLETIMNSMMSGIVIIDGLTHKVIDTNNTALKMIGVSREDFLGKVCYNYICPTETGKCPITDLGLNIENKERILLNSNGSQIPILKSVVKIMADDRPILIENFVDISERKKMEGLLLKSERLASIGELAGQVGHDLRNPLTGIKGGVYLLKKKTDIDEAHKLKIINLIEDAIDDSNRIINSLLEYSAEMRLDLSSYHLNEILSSAAKKTYIPERIKIIQHIDDDLMVTADYERMENVFLKLFKNAVEAIPGEGTIEIEARQLESEIEISLTDSGTGIPGDLLPKVFTPLTTTKAKGMGLGLAICKRVIDAHEGKIMINQSPSKGYNVSIRLPVKAKTEFMIDTNWATANVRNLGATNR